MLRHLLILPRARRWLRTTIAAHESHSRPIADCGFKRLHRRFSPDVLARARLAIVDRVPQPPLSAWGIAGEGLLATDAAGITLERMIFVRRGLQRDESLIFHELVHAIQWAALGVNRFLALYGLLLLERGYAEHPLEMIAYQLQAAFDDGEFPPDVEAVVARQARERLGQMRARSLAHRCIFSMLP